MISPMPWETDSLAQLVHTTKMRWRIERDDRELKQEVGLGHYEGRNWRGFHHHATLTIAVYRFLLLQRLQGWDKKGALPQAPAYRAAGECAGRGRGKFFMTQSN